MKKAPLWIATPAFFRSLLVALVCLVAVPAGAVAPAVEASGGPPAAADASPSSTSPARHLPLSPYAQVGCGVCDVGLMCANLGGEACNGMTDAVAGGYAMEAALGGALFGGLGTLGGAALGTGVGALMGAAYVFLGPTRNPSREPTTEEYLAAAVLFGVIGAVVGGLLGLGTGVVYGIRTGPKFLRRPPPPPPPRAQGPTRRGPSRVGLGDVFAY